MLRQPLIFLLVALEMFLRTPFHAAVDGQLAQLVLILTQHTAVVGVIPLNHKEILVMTNHLRVNTGIGTSAERQVIHGIQQVGLTGTVRSDKTIHLRRQRQCCLLDILVVNDG